MRLIAVLLCCLFWVYQPGQVLAETSSPLTQGLSVGYQPPQASAAALITLPTVYAQPGTFWYWAKHVWEEAQLLITLDESQRADLLLKFSQERLAEGYQAMKDGKADTAIASLSRYQHQQQQLATSLDQLQQDKSTIEPILRRLQDQLGVQQALEQWSKEHQVSPKVTELLHVQPLQMLAFQQFDRQYLLGARSLRLHASGSAQATSAAQATATAQASTSSTEQGGIQ